MTTNSKNLYKLLNFSDNEMKVFNILKGEGGLYSNEAASGIDVNHPTPLSIARATNIPRPTLYITLDLLKNRGLAERYMINAKKYWRLTHQSEIVELLQNTKRLIVDGVSGGHSINITNQDNQNSKAESPLALNEIVNLYRGKEEIKSLLNSLTAQHKDERWYSMQGADVSGGWFDIFGIEGMNHFNRMVKKNNLITEALLPTGWHKIEFAKYGKAWAEDFVDRMAAVYEIDAKYFDHSGQIFIFNNALYLMALKEETVIEIKNSQIQKIVLAMFDFIKENARRIDLNAELKKLIVSETK